MIIVINTGSTSKKYAIYDGDKMMIHFHFESVSEGYVLHQRVDGKFQKDIDISDDTYQRAFDFVIDVLISESYIKYESDIEAAVFRIVAPGKYFTYDRVIDDEFLLKLDEIREQAPLHIDNMRDEFDQVLDRLHDVKIIGVSDSRFHRDIKDYVSAYALPREIRDEVEVKRYGYHGISVSSIVDMYDNFDERVIVCHLGGGSSITALKNGKSVDNSMGYSPLEGLPMSTRVGNIDAGAIISIEDKMDLDLGEIRDILYYKSGLKGLSGGLDDIRELLEAKENGDEFAKLAIDHYVYNIQKVIGSYYTILGGLDRLILTGTIGYKSAPIRKMICDGLDILGIEVDDNMNSKLDGEGYINKPGSEVTVDVVLTREEDEMAKRAIDLL